MKPSHSKGPPDKDGPCLRLVEPPASAIARNVSTPLPPCADDLDVWHGDDHFDVRRFQRSAERLLNRGYSMEFVLRRLHLLPGFKKALRARSLTDD